MKIISERIGDAIVVTIEDSGREIALVLPLETATRLGTTLLMQVSLGSSDVTVPAEWSETET